jgi:hypothetical protein
MLSRTHHQRTRGSQFKKRFFLCLKIFSEAHLGFRIESESAVRYCVTVKLVALLATPLGVVT